MFNIKVVTHILNDNGSNIWKTSNEILVKN